MASPRERYSVGMTTWTRVVFIRVLRLNIKQVNKRSLKMRLRKSAYGKL